MRAGRRVAMLDSGGREAWNAQAGKSLCACHVAEVGGALPREGKWLLMERGEVAGQYWCPSIEECTLHTTLCVHSIFIYYVSVYYIYIVLHVYILCIYYRAVHCTLCICIVLYVYIYYIDVYICCIIYCLYTIL